MAARRSIDRRNDQLAGDDITERCVYSQSDGRSRMTAGGGPDGCRTLRAASANAYRALKQHSARACFAGRGRCSWRRGFTARVNDSSAIH
jgi:hypothetical protein